MLGAHLGCGGENHQGKSEGKEKKPPVAVKMIQGRRNLKKAGSCLQVKSHSRASLNSLLNLWLHKNRCFLPGSEANRLNQEKCVELRSTTMEYGMSAEV
jgi:hypothetical protein